METTPDRTFVNAPIDQELLEKLDTMVKAKESTRAQFIRLLVREAWEEFERIENLKNKVAAPKISRIKAEL